MTTNLIERRSVTNELLKTLRRVVDKEIGDHRAPDVTTADEGYAIVYSIPGGSFDGPPLTAPESLITFVYQVTSCGWTREQAEWVSDHVRDAIVGRNDDGTLKHVIVGVNERWTDTIPGGIEVEGEPPLTVYQMVDRFALWVAESVA